MKHTKTHAPRTFPEIITDGAEKFGDNVALVTEGRRITYDQLLSMVEQLAEALRLAGVEPADRVALVLPNDWPFVVSVFATVMSGAIVVPLDVTVRPRNFLHVVRNCAVKALIVDERAVARLRPVLTNREESPRTVFMKGEKAQLPQKDWYSFDGVFRTGRTGTANMLSSADPTAVVSISYTSGSTGAPKGVMHSHQSWLSGAHFTAEYFNVSQTQMIVIPLPLHHAYSFRHLIAYLLRGAAVLITEDVLAALRLLKSEEPNALLLVPAACNIILNHFRELIGECGTFLELVSIGTAPIAERQFQEFRALLPKTEMYLPYGLTEARVGFLRPSDEDSSRRIFAVQPGLELRVVDQGGNRTEPGETGEIVLRGAGLMVGYWPGSESEKRRLQQWGFATKDLGRLEENGEIALLGRGDDMIEIGGRKVAPLEVEDMLLQHPSVLEAAVMGITSPNGLVEREIKATVVLQPGHSASEEELTDYCTKNLEPYKVPAQIVFESSLKRSSVGKIIRKGEGNGGTGS